MFFESIALWVWISKDLSEVQISKDLLCTHCVNDNNDILTDHQKTARSHSMTGTDVDYLTSHYHEDSNTLMVTMVPFGMSTGFVETNDS